MVLDYLLFLYESGLGYSSINTARSALSSEIFCDGVPAGSHPLVIRFMTGIFKLRPSLPKYTTTWDPQVVLKMLSKWYPNSKLSLTKLTLKLVTIIALITGQRLQTVHLLKLSNMVKTDSAITFAITDIIKTTKKGSHIEPIVFKRYREDDTLCVVKVLREYIKRTQVHRSNKDKLFLTTVKPYQEASKNTLARWVKTTLALSGIDTKKFSAHSTRSASTSYVSKFVPTSVILKAANWSSSNTFAKFYNKPIARPSFAETMLKGSSKKKKGGGDK